MGWIYLLFAVVIEVAWASTLKATDGYTRPGPTALNLLLSLANLVVLAQAIKLLPTGLAYAVWTGLGAVGVALVAYWLQGEAFGAAKIASIGMILIGVTGLKVFATA
jgi:quaternary ammonium compound-resistance protein SugE